MENKPEEQQNVEPVPSETQQNEAQQPQDQKASEDAMVKQLETAMAKDEPRPEVQPDAVPSESKTVQQGADAEESKTSEAQNEAPVERSLQEAKDVLEKCKWNYQEHKLDAAYRFMKELQSMEKSIPKDDLPAYQEILNEQQSLFYSLESENEYLQAVVNELQDKDGYKFEEIGKNAYIAYKVAGNNLVTIKTQAEVEVPVAHLLAMINEVELWKLWNALMTKTAEVGTIHRAAKVYYVEYGLPYPLANREIHLYGIGVNRLHENGTVMILAKSVDHDNEFFAKHNMQRSSLSRKGSAYVDVHLGAFEITPQGRDKCILRGVTNIDPKFGWIPHKVLNWVLKKGTMQMNEKIIHGAKNFKGSAWEKEIKSDRKKEFYEWLDVQMEEYYATQERKSKEDLDEKATEQTQSKL